MKGVNKVTLLGTLGIDPDGNKATDGVSFARISLATSDRWKDRDTGITREKTEWHQIVFYNKLAEVVMNHLNKGDMVYVDAALQTQKWKDKDTGETKHRLQIVGKSIEILGPRQPSIKDDDEPQPLSNENTDPRIGLLTT